MPALIKTPASTHAGQNVLESTLGTSTTTSWHPAPTSGHSWLSMVPLSSTLAGHSSSETSKSVVHGISIIPANQASTQPSTRLSHVPTHGFPLISAQSTANMLFDQITDLMPLFEAWLQGDVGSTGALTDAMKIARDTALLTAYQSGGFLKQSDSCGASLMHTASCIVNTIVKAEENLTKNSRGCIVRISKVIEKHQRRLLKFLRLEEWTSSAIPVPVSAPTVDPGSTISIASTGSARRPVASETASIIAGPPVSTGAGSQSGGAASMLASAVASNAEPPEISTGLATDSSTDSVGPSVATPTKAGTKNTETHAATTPKSSSTAVTGTHSWTKDSRVTPGHPTTAKSPKGKKTATSEGTASTASSILPPVITEAPNHDKRYYEERDSAGGDANGRDYGQADHYNNEEPRWEGWPHHHPNRWRPEYEHGPYREHPHHHRPADEPCHDKPHHDKLRDHKPYAIASSPTSSSSVDPSGTIPGPASQVITSENPSVTMTGSSIPSEPVSTLPSAMPSDSPSMQASAQPSGAASTFSTGVTPTSTPGSRTQSKLTLTEAIKTSSSVTVSTV